uniref:Uncharacterized protein n=1 Tax=Anguilla anguilla TaxID=7936 RepID=A0A0E9X8N5_ANGAN
MASQLVLQLIKYGINIFSERLSVFFVTLEAIRRNHCSDSNQLLQTAVEEIARHNRQLLSEYPRWTLGQDPLVKTKLA